VVGLQASSYRDLIGLLWLHGSKARDGFNRVYAAIGSRIDLELTPNRITVTDTLRFQKKKGANNWVRKRKAMVIIF
jgi:hypothetical protein